MRLFLVPFIGFNAVSADPHHCDDCVPEEITGENPCGTHVSVTRPDDGEGTGTYYARQTVDSERFDGESEWTVDYTQWFVKICCRSS